MSFILWFCCGCATDPPERHQPPPPQTQVVAVVQAPPSSINQLPPPPLPAATGYAVAPHQSSPWAHAPYITSSYDDPPQPLPWSQAAHPVYAPAAPSPPTPVVPEQAAVPPRRVPSDDDDSPPPPVTQKPPAYRSSIMTTAHDYPVLPSAAQTIPSCVPSSTDPPWPARQPSKTTATYRQASARSTSGGARDSSPPLPAPVVPSQRPPQTASPARQPSKKTARPQPPPVPLPPKGFATPAWSEGLPPGALMDPPAPQLIAGVQNYGDPRTTLESSLVQSNRLTFQNETTFYKTS
jgi:hypothetical protein